MIDVLQSIILVDFVADHNNYVWFVTLLFLGEC